MWIQGKGFKRLIHKLCVLYCSFFFEGAIPLGAKDLRLQKENEKEVEKGRVMAGKVIFPEYNIRNIISVLEIARLYNGNIVLTVSIIEMNSNRVGPISLP